MLYFDRIDVSQGVSIRKNATKECDICYYCYFLNDSFNFQPNVCNRFHDLFMMSVKLSDIAVLNIEHSDHHCIISLNNKNEAKNLTQNADLTKESGTLQSIKNFFCIWKWVKKC